MNGRKLKIYKPIFWINSIILIFLIILLDVYLVIRVKAEIRDYEYYISEKVLEEINNEIDYIHDYSHKLVSFIYDDSFLISDIIRLLNTDAVDYLEYKLNYLYNSRESSYNGIENFIKISLMGNENLRKISLISFELGELRSFDKFNNVIVEDISMSKDTPIQKYYGGEGSLSLVKEINEPNNLSNQGLMVFTYDLDFLSDVYNKYKKDRKILILDYLGYVIYDSNENFDYKVNSGYNMGDFDKAGEFFSDKGHYVNGNTYDNDIRILSVTKRSSREFYVILFPLFITFVFVIVIYVLFCRRISFFKNDAKSYIKNSEIIALESQINPHFLYNTLESIRMKAICNNDREVGKMIYILSMLFRKQVKDSHIVTLSNELEYCGKYIEIFKVRYSGKFKFHIECDDYLKGVNIPKFILQPIVENYFVHGIRKNDEDNSIKIKVYSHDDNIFIDVIDNGYGISEENRNILNDKLRQGLGQEDSIGIINVHKRIILEYGEAYGISLITNDKKENIVRLKIPCKGVY